MSWSFTAHRGSANNKTSGVVLSVTPSAQVNAGAILVAVCSSDNIATAGGQSSTHVVVDFLGNPWGKLLEWTNAAAAAAGITGSIWACRVRRPLTTADPVVLGLRSAALAKTIGLYQYAVAANATARFVRAVGSEQDATVSPTVTLNGLEAGQYAMFGVTFRENDSIGTYTPAAGFNDRTAFGTTGGTAATNVSCIVGDRVITGVTETYAPTVLAASSDVVTMLVAMREVPVKAPNYAFNDSSAADLRAAIREKFKTANAADLVRYAYRIELEGLNDTQLKALFGVNDSQLPGLKIKIVNLASLYEAMLSAVGE